jgi:hypothetical protein
VKSGAEIGEARETLIRLLCSPGEVLGFPGVHFSSIFEELDHYGFWFRV